MRNLANFSAYRPSRADTPTLLIVPGLNDSAPDHWQSRWERNRPNARRAKLGLWDKPDPDIWVSRLDEAIRAIDGPVVIAAHSLGCHVVAHWAQRVKAKSGGSVIAALLVAPPEIDRGLVDWRLQPFAPSSQSILPFPSTLVASQNDPYIHFERARRLAFFWGSQFADAGPVGHINAESGFGDWDFGQFLLDRLTRLALAEREAIDVAHAGGQPPGSFHMRLTPAPIITA